MGRPVNKRYFGAVVDGTADGNFSVNVKVGAATASPTGVILNQRSTNKFKVDDAAAGSGNEGICTLVDKALADLGNNEMSLLGYVAGAGDAIRIKKIYNRTCRDFSNNRYKWTITDDSTQNIMVLTAL